jgi:DNA-binding transcriptional LysR family regulator
VDLQQLETFVAVARELSFTRAAESVHLTQPGVSRQIQRIEQELEVALVGRRRGGIELTPAGERFRAWASEVLQSHRQLVKELRASTEGLTGELRIAASTTPGDFLVPWLAAGFAAGHPGVHPRVVIANSMEVLEELRHGRCEVAFTGMKVPGRDLTFHPVADDEVVLAVPDHHPFAARGEVALAELAGQPFLEREPDSGTFQTFLAAVSERGLALPAWRAVMVLSSGQAVVSGVQSGHGLGLVSSLALQDRSPERVVAVRLAGLPLRRRLYLVTDKGRTLPRPATAFVAWVLEVTTAAGRPKREMKGPPSTPTP